MCVYVDIVMICNFLHEQLQVKNELSELLAWLEPLANQLDQHEPIAGTMEELQVQHDWLKVNYFPKVYYML